MRTLFQDFTRDNGLPVTVEYAVEGSYSPTTYSPLYGADGGDTPVFYIVRAWPNTALHNWFARLALYGLRVQGAALTDFGHWLACAPGRALVALDEWMRASLTDAERGRMEDWIAEHHVEDGDDYEPDWR